MRARPFQFLTNFGPHHVNSWGVPIYLQPVARFVIYSLNGNDVCHGRHFDIIKRNICYILGISNLILYTD